jgi:glutamate dehydrogenase/leucine dehydrogenase
MLSLDITEYRIFSPNSPSNCTVEHSILDVTMSSNEDMTKKQQSIINQHKKKIDYIMSTIKSMKDETSRKMVHLVDMMTALKEVTTHKSSKKQAPTGGGKGTSNRSPH